MHHGNLIVSQKWFEIIIIKIHIKFVLTGKELRTKNIERKHPNRTNYSLLKLGPRLNWMSTVCYRCGGAPDLSYTVSRVSQTTPQSSLYDYTTVLGVAGPLRLYIYTHKMVYPPYATNAWSQGMHALYSNVRYYVMNNFLQNNAQS